MWLLARLVWFWLVQQSIGWLLVWVQALVLFQLLVFDIFRLLHVATVKLLLDEEQEEEDQDGECVKL